MARREHRRASDAWSLSALLSIAILLNGCAPIDQTRIDPYVREDILNYCGDLISGNATRQCEFEDFYRERLHCERAGEHVECDAKAPAHPLPGMADYYARLAMKSQVVARYACSRESATCELVEQRVTRAAMWAPRPRSY